MDGLQFTLDEVVAFMDAKIPNQKCPMCGEINWLVETDSKESGRVMVVAAPLIHDPSKCLVYVPAFCGNCAYATLYGAGQIKAWLEERGKG